MKGLGLGNKNMFIYNFHVFLHFININNNLFTFWKNSKRFSIWVSNEKYRLFIFQFILFVYIT
jgi:hypothetical protein